MYIIWDHFLGTCVPFYPFFFFTVCYTSSTRDDLKDKQSAYFSERIRNTASTSCNTFVTLFSNGRVHLCKLDRANPRPSRSLNNTLDALLPNSNKSLMETHTMQTLPPFSNVHTHTHIHTGPNHLRVSLTAFPTSLLSVDRPVQQLGPRLMSPTLLLVPFFFFSSLLPLSLFGLAQTCGRAGRGRLRRSLLSGQSHM